MIELGFPYIDGYKPRGDSQELLRAEVQIQLTENAEVERVTEAVVEATATQPSVTADPAEIFVDPPKGCSPGDVRATDRRHPASSHNYLEREARNQSLGRAGEVFALEAEHRRLWHAGDRRLADRIEHVSATKGDGLGYDILSFEADGREDSLWFQSTAFDMPFSPRRRKSRCRRHSRRFSCTGSSSSVRLRGSLPLPDLCGSHRPRTGAIPRFSTMTPNEPLKQPPIKLQQPYTNSLAVRGRSPPAAERHCLSPAGFYSRRSRRAVHHSARPAHGCGLLLGTEHRRPTWRRHDDYPRHTNHRGRRHCEGIDHRRNVRHVRHPDPGALASADFASGNATAGDR